MTMGSSRLSNCNNSTSCPSGKHTHTNVVNPAKRNIQVTSRAIAVLLLQYANQIEASVKITNSVDHYTKQKNNPPITELCKPREKIKTVEARIINIITDIQNGKSDQARQLCDIVHKVAKKMQYPNTFTLMASLKELTKPTIYTLKAA